MTEVGQGQPGSSEASPAPASPAPASGAAAPAEAPAADPFGPLLAPLTLRTDRRAHV